uniref:Uncharacterized protein n=1 Tax=Pyramimonas orientalis virus TaxID=455367 RepID=A0A7M3UNP8_POV01|nr:hypothetical protein HWQ62_00186 [Pyramimonas orientalis virus]
MDTIKTLHNFLLPHLHQQNIQEGLGLMFDLTEKYNQLQNEVCVLHTKLEFLTRENDIYKRQSEETQTNCDSLLTEIQRLNNTNLVNFLQLTKFELEEQKHKIKSQMDDVVLIHPQPINK